MNKTTQSHPDLPEYFQLPLKIVPVQLKYLAISRALNTLFADPLVQGELDFLGHKKINIRIEDSALEFCVSLREGRLIIGQPLDSADLSISGKAYTFLVLGTRTEDADTLFFNRQLKNEGDTELGLFVKNFLDGIDLQTLPAHRVLDACMHKALQIADKTTSPVYN